MEDHDHTPVRRLRASDDLWDAFETVCKRVFGQSRSKNLVEHMRATVREHGNKEELKKLERDEAETAARQSRIRQGRPRKTAN